ncbi:uncharacterized protein LOC105186194 isoform X2 [Harpegnathos saltator]|uniref:uncharacterized protein LOC105186194 isoform X2 n=1 Tax=Harpegnathos saltator TaxID=610380 RepID=UPI000DBECF10|nr:uncharacterized protein LOC105186194 isoform X2 [Harpegnathos saltator]
MEIVMIIYKRQRRKLLEQKIWHRILKVQELKRKRNLYDINETQSAPSNENSSDDEVTIPTKFPTPPNCQDAAFKKQVLCQLQLLNFKHTQMSEDIQTILTKIAGQGDNLLLMNDEETIFHKFDFPLKNISELNSVKHYLADDNNAIMMLLQIDQRIHKNWRNYIQANHKKNEFVIFKRSNRKLQLDWI